MDFALLKNHLCLGLEISAAGRTSFFNGSVFLDVFNEIICKEITGQERRERKRDGEKRQKEKSEGGKAKGKRPTRTGLATS